MVSSGSLLAHPIELSLLNEIANFIKNNPNCPQAEFR